MSRGAARDGGDRAAGQRAEGYGVAVDGRRRTEEDKPGRSVSIADLVGAMVHHADGRRLGRVVDVEFAIGGEMRVTGLLIGGWTWLQRLGVARPLRRVVEDAGRHRIVPWEGVERWDGLRVDLRPGAQIREAEGAERVPHLEKPPLPGES